MGKHGGVFDYFGYIYEADVISGYKASRLGQFFTPYEVAKLIARLTMENKFYENKDRLGSVLAENGYILNAYDFRGHGKSAENAISAGYGTFGKIANKDGFNIAIEDLKEIIQGVKNDFPGKKVILLGHSFGSFVSQG